VQQNIDDEISDAIDLCSGTLIEGPAIIQQADSTCVIDPGTTAKIDSVGNLIIDVLLHNQ
jgi:N-methylhydantoinase A